MDAPSSASPSPALVLEPVLRHVGPTEATIWVETDCPCEVEVLGARARTFGVAGHHYALVHVTGLEPGTAQSYRVTLDGSSRWPPGDSRFPPSRIRTPGPGDPVTVAFGSCRVALPHQPPYTITKDRDPRGRENDALRSLAERMLGMDEEAWPTLLVMLGDQVYADEGSPKAREFIRRRRDTDHAPGLEAADFEEYTRLYWESWSEPLFRWLLSTVPSAMIFDDHEVRDDWNISAAWAREAWAQPWWERRVVGAFMSYWLYQHLGNLAPAELDEDPLWRRARESDDAEPALREFASRAAHSPEGTRWSYARDVGGVRLVVVDSRAGRVLEGRRMMVDDEEWAWVVEQVRGDVDHVLIASSLPVFLPTGMHHLEAWSEAVCDGAWGRLAAGIGERIRRALDLDHWGAFGESFSRLVDLLRSVGAGERGRPPASLVVISGDVHHAYLAEVGFRREAMVRSAVYQVVCSPIRNPLDARERRAIRFGASRQGTAIGSLLARAARVPRPDVRWRLVAPPMFDNQVATFTARARTAFLTVEKTVPAEGETRLVTTLARRLA